MAFSTVGTKRNRCLDFFLSHCPVPKTVHPDLAQSAVSICRGWVKFDSLLRRAFRNLPIFIRSSPQTDVGVSQSDIGWSKLGISDDRFLEILSGFAASCISAAVFLLVGVIAALHVRLQDIGIHPLRPCSLRLVRGR